MSASRLLMWGCIAGFLLSGIPLLFVSDRDSGRLIAGIAAIFLGGFAVGMGLDAARTGVLQLQHTSIQRSAKPRLFLAAVTGVISCGVGVIGGAVVILLSGR